MSTKGYNFPQCLDDLELGMAENILDFHPEFVLQASQLVSLEDKSSHLDFCIDETGDDHLTVALYCRKKLKCEENFCIRRCCHMGEVYINGSCTYPMQEMPMLEEGNGTNVVYGFQPKCSNLIQSDIIEGKTFEEYCIIDVPDVGETFLICDENKDRKVRILAISMIASVIFLVLTAVIIWTRNKVPFIYYVSTFIAQN